MSAGGAEQAIVGRVLAPNRLSIGLTLPLMPGGQEVVDGGYLEIHGSTEGELTVKAGKVEESIRWGQILAEQQVEQGIKRILISLSGYLSHREAVVLGIVRFTKSRQPCFVCV